MIGSEWNRRARISEVLSNQDERGDTYRCQSFRNTGVEKNNASAKGAWCCGAKLVLAYCIIKQVA